jgi:uncharacterized membrane protein
MSNKKRPRKSKAAVQKSTANRLKTAELQEVKEALEQANISGATKEQVMIRVREDRLWQGPLPPPESLGHYEQVLPGSADRILGMAEASIEQEHAQFMAQTRVIDNAHRRGAWLASGLLALFLGAGTVSAFYGHTAFACACVGTGAVSIIAKAITGKGKEI